MELLGYIVFGEKVKHIPLSELLDPVDQFGQGRPRVAVDAYPDAPQKPFVPVLRACRGLGVHIARRLGQTGEQRLRQRVRKCE